MMTSFYKSFLDIIAPPFCQSCALLLSQRIPFCIQCQTLIKPLVSTSLKITENHHLSVFAVSAYEDPLRKLILGKNYSNIIAARWLGILMAEHCKTILPPNALLIPMPLHWTRYAWRGFNQAEIMAKALSELTDLQSQPLLKRNRRTLFQSQLNATDRAQNVKKAFTLSSLAPAYKQRHLILVDDLMTTGATLHAAARELLILQPLSLTALVACRVV